MRAFSLPLEFQVLALCPVRFGEQVRVPSFHIWNLIHSFIRSVGIYRTPTISQTFFLDSGTSVYTTDSTFLPTLNVHSSAGRRSVNVMLKSVTEDIEEGKRGRKGWNWSRAANKFSGDVREEVAFEERLKRRGASKPQGRLEG